MVSADDIDTKVEAVNGTFQISADDFLDLMWNKKPFWSRMMEHTHQYDFEVISRDKDGLIYCSKMKMLNFNVPMLNVPSHCEQQTIVEIKREGDSMTVETVTQAAEFPMSDTFEIRQKYELKKATKTSTKIKLTSCLRFTKPVSFVVKPFLRREVVKSMQMFGVDLTDELGNLNKQIA